MNSEFILTQGAGQKLEFAIQRNGGGASDIEWLSSGENFKSVIQLARGNAELVVKRIMIRVDRSAKPVYPDWVRKVMHSELEAIGPAEYSLGDVEQWLHEDQKKDGSKWIGGERIYEHLKTNNVLESQLGLADLQVIQKLGIATFRKHFAGKAVFGWKSVVLGRSGDLYVPYLIGGGVEVELFWHWLDDVWYAHYPALRFRK